MFYEISKVENSQNKLTYLDTLHELLESMHRPNFTFPVYSNDYIDYNNISLEKSLFDISEHLS